jgi:hypothetical protein
MAVGAGDIVRADVRGIFNGVTAVQNSFHLRNDGTSVDEADAVDDIVELLEALYTLLSAFLNTLWVIQNIRVINESDNSDVGIGTFVDTTPGNDSQEAVPQNAYGLILDTQRLASKGRKFFGPASGLGWTTGGLLNVDSVADLADMGDYMIVAQVATNSTWRFGILSTLDGVGFLPFIGYGISPTIVTQRRRRIGVGI